MYLVLFEHLTLQMGVQSSAQSRIMKKNNRNASRGHMRQQGESSPTQGNIARNVQEHSNATAITQFKIDERARWKKRVMAFIFWGILVSLLVHIILGFVLRLMEREGVYAGQEETATIVEFAFQESESLSEMPTEQLLEQEVAKTEATSDALATTQATLSADVSTSSLQASISSVAPSLAGGVGGGGLMGGSGGGTSFFGIASSGSRFCYIVDTSASMKHGERLESAMQELANSLHELPDFARFFILFYSDRAREPSIQKGWNTAHSSTIRRMEKEFSLFEARGGTLPRHAFVKAFELKPLPDVIFFLTDGALSNFTVETLKELMPKGKRIVVNTIAFGDSAAQDVLIAIAKETGGQFTFVRSGSTP